MTVRAKLMCTSKEGNAVRFSAQYDTSIPEDQRFQTATPWGNAEFGIDNPSAMNQFEVGKTYYVDFSEAT